VKRAAVALVLAACGTSAPLPPDCSTVANGVKRYWAERAQDTKDPALLAAIGETSRTAAEKLERHCVADHWNDDMIACVRAVFRLEDSGCMKFMSPLQKSKWHAGEDAPKVRGGMGVGG
jgi:hypothetical protein